MHEVILLTPISGASGAFEVGDTYRCASKEEALRFIAAGIAKAKPAKRETTARKSPAKETRQG